MQPQKTRLHILNRSQKRSHPPCNTHTHPFTPPPHTPPKPPPHTHNHTSQHPSNHQQTPLHAPQNNHTQPITTKLEGTGTNTHKNNPTGTIQPPHQPHPPPAAIKTDVVGHQTPYTHPPCTSSEPPPPPNPPHYTSSHTSQRQTPPSTAPPQPTHPSCPRLPPPPPSSWQHTPASHLRPPQDTSARDTSPILRHQHLSLHHISTSRRSHHHNTLPHQHQKPQLACLPPRQPTPAHACSRRPTPPTPLYAHPAHRRCHPPTSTDVYPSSQTPGAMPPQLRTILQPLKHTHTIAPTVTTYNTVVQQTTTGIRPAGQAATLSSCIHTPRGHHCTSNLQADSAHSSKHQRLQRYPTACTRPAAPQPPPTGRRLKHQKARALRPHRLPHTLTCIQ